jgi:hypothetical protein
LGTNPTTTGATITGLAASTRYDVEVAANNTGGVASAYVDYGQSPVATTSAGSASGVPDVVTLLAAGTVTGNTVPLTWTAPTVSGSHAAATAYTVQYRINGSSIWQTATATASSTAYTVASLISGQTYQFNVFGTNTNGVGTGTTITGTFPPRIILQVPSSLIRTTDLHRQPGRWEPTGQRQKPTSRACPLLNWPTAPRSFGRGPKAIAASPTAKRLPSRRHNCGTSR